MLKENQDLYKKDAMLSVCSEPYSNTITVGERQTCKRVSVPVM